MKILILASLCFLVINARVFADSDCYGCYADGVIAFDQALKIRPDFTSFLGENLLASLKLLESNFHVPTAHIHKG